MPKQSTNPKDKAQTKPVRILALCDSIVARPRQAITGFGRVAYNLFTRMGVPVDIWAIGFEGYGYKPLSENYPHLQLIPGGDHDWNSAARLDAFLRQLAGGHYTHVFILMDTDAISCHNFPAQLRDICRQKEITSCLYYPVDAPLQRPFEIISAVDLAVCFTEYGAAETKKVLKFRDVKVMAHGIDEHFTPVTPEERAVFRAQFLTNHRKPFLQAGDLLIIGVNKNEPRKDPLRMLEILAGLIEAEVPAKMILRMDGYSAVGGINLERAAEQLGLVLDRDWGYVPPIPESHMRAFYGAADLYLTTSLGEGWGLGVTEALGCGTPVAIPAHTSLQDIGMKVMNSAREWDFAQSMSHLPATRCWPVKFLDLEYGYVCGYDNRLRRRVDLDSAIDNLGKWLLKDLFPNRVTLKPEILEWLSWDRITEEFLKLLEIVAPPAPKGIEVLLASGQAALGPGPSGRCLPNNLRVEVKFTISVREKNKTHNQGKENNMPPTVQLTTVQQTLLTAVFETATGAPVSVVGVPVWSVDNPVTVTLVPSEDGLSCEVIAVAPGAANITLTGQGDATAGVDVVTGQVQVTVVAAEASQVVITVGTPTIQPAAAAAASGSAPGAATGGNSGSVGS